MSRLAAAGSRRRGAIVMGAVLASATIAVSACSSSGSSAPSSTPAKGASPAPTGTPIKIGVAGAQTGDLASLAAPGVGATRAWAAYVNDHGGVAGHPVTLYVSDTRSNPTAGLAAAQSLVQTDGVAAMVVDDPAAEAAIAPYLQQRKIPLLGVGYSVSVYGAGKGIPGLSNVYSPAASIIAQNLGTVFAAKALNQSSLGLALCTSSPACSEATGLFSKAAPGFGIKFTGAVDVATSAASYVGQCVHFLTTKTNFIALISDSATAQLVANACIQQGFKGVFGAESSTVVLSDLAKAPGATYAGDLQGFPWWVNDPAVAQFRDAMKQYEPSVESRSALATATWSTLQLMAKAVANAAQGPKAQVTSQTLAQDYTTIKGETLGGLLPAPITYTAGKAAEQPSCFWMYKYKAGDANPTLIPAQGTSGNGQSGDLATTCASTA
jgi:branched-chain amino acid transport system substrate-binding protein